MWAWSVVTPGRADSGYTIALHNFQHVLTTQTIP